MGKNNPAEFVELWIHILSYLAIALFLMVHSSVQYQHFFFP